jgi:flagellar motor switch protein FliM
VAYKIYGTIILSVVMCGCETWSLTLREERRLKVFENRVMRKIFGRKREELTREWKKLHSEELNDLYCSPNIAREIK